LWQCKNTGRSFCGHVPNNIYFVTLWHIWKRDIEGEYTGNISLYLSLNWTLLSCDIVTRDKNLLCTFLFSFTLVYYWYDVILSYQNLRWFYPSLFLLTDIDILKQWNPWNLFLNFFSRWFHGMGHGDLALFGYRNSLLFSNV
jgi:hypothetical protein